MFGDQINVYSNGEVEEKIGKFMMKKMQVQRWKLKIMGKVQDEGIKGKDGPFLCVPPKYSEVEPSSCRLPAWQDGDQVCLNPFFHY